MRTEHEREENWNMGSYYFKTLGLLDQYMTEALIRKDLRGALDALTTLFIKTSPYCWETDKDEEFKKFEKRLNGITNLVYHEDTWRDPELESKLLDRVREFVRDYYWKLKKMEVLSPVRTRQDPYNSPV